MRDTLPSSFTGSTAAAALAALGNPMRLLAFRHIAAAARGLNVGELQTLLGMPASTLNHHLGILVRSGLVRQTRQGREIRNTLEAERLRELAMFLDEMALLPGAQ